MLNEFCYIITKNDKLRQNMQVASMFLYTLMGYLPGKILNTTGY